MGWDLIIFDCDGVLVDSEPVANRVLAELLREGGLEISVEETIRRFIGHSVNACMEIAIRLGATLPDDFAGRYRDRCAAAFAEELRAVDGVKEALDAIPIPYCVASSSSHARIRLSLSLVGLLDRFEGRIFSAQDVTNGKPAPDIFLHTAAQMGASPQRCLVVEDTTIGVQAGRAAGMTVLGFARFTPADALTAAGAIPFIEMRRLPEIIRSL